jgi:colanic acid/amylovoran biosynthesis protein
VSPAYQAIKKTIQDASIVIASGGDVFSSDYGSLKRHLKPLELALEAGVPVVFLAQSIGPFKTGEETQDWLRVARHAKLITIREQLSYDYVTKDLGLSTDLVKHTADPAFLLRPSPQAVIDDILGFYRITKQRPLIALAVSRGISHFTARDYNRHLETWRQVTNMILDKLDAHVLLIPHVQDIRVQNDDRILATDLLRSLEFDPRVWLIGADHSAAEFKGLIATCDMVIAERMHAAIAGLSSGVCTVAVGYSVKAEGIMTDLLGAELTQNVLMIPIAQFLDIKTACMKICLAWNQRHEVTSHLIEILPRIKKEAASNFAMISQLLGSNIKVRV